MAVDTIGRMNNKVFIHKSCNLKVCTILDTCEISF